MPFMSKPKDPAHLCRTCSESSRSHREGRGRAFRRSPCLQLNTTAHGRCMSLRAPSGCFFFYQTTKQCGSSIPQERTQLSLGASKIQRMRAHAWRWAMGDGRW